jgi:uncharacterized protein YjbI with pentapeptide repeats
MDLNKVLESFARGEINKEKAREMIHSAYAKVSAKAHEIREEGEKEFESSETAGESFRKAFDKIKKTKNIDDFLKVSSGLVHQIAEKMPGEIEKIQENVLNDMNIAGFSANIKGVTSKFSIFRNFDVERNCEVEENLAVGSQWFAVRFTNKAQVIKNKFTAVQLSEVDVNQSNFSTNSVALSRVSNVTLLQAKIEGNRFSRATLSDTSMTESDFMGNTLSKSELAQTVINGSRIAKCQYMDTTLRECDFDDCNLQGIVFENCRFEECSFVNVQVVADAGCAIADQVVVGRTFTDIRSFEDLVKALCEGSSGSSLDTANDSTQKSVRSPSAPKRERTGRQTNESERAAPRRSTSQKAAQNAHRKHAGAQKQSSTEKPRRVSSAPKRTR